MSVLLRIRYALDRLLGRKRRPPSGRNRALARRLNLSIEPWMQNSDVYQLIQAALVDPSRRVLFDALQAEESAAAEREEREELGDTLYEESKRWEQLCDPHAHYLVTFKKGETMQTDVVEFEAVDVDRSRARSPIRVSILRPKKFEPRGEDAYLSWEREVSLRPDQILRVERLPTAIDEFDVERYERTIGSRVRDALDLRPAGEVHVKPKGSASPGFPRADAE